MKSDDDRLVVEKILDLYLGLPQTPSCISRDDRHLARSLCRELICETCGTRLALIFLHFYMPGNTLRRLSLPISRADQLFFEPVEFDFELADFSTLSWPIC